MFEVVCNPWECKYLHCFSGGEVKWSDVIDTDDVVIVFVCNEDSIEVFYLRPEHLLSKIGARVDKDIDLLVLQECSGTEPFVMRML